MGRNNNNNNNDKNQTSKNHHWVPMFYLKQWGLDNQQGKIICINAQTKDVKKKYIRSCCAETDFYSFSSSSVSNVDNRVWFEETFKQHLRIENTLSSIIRCVKKELEDAKQRIIFWKLLHKPINLEIETELKCNMAQQLSFLYMGTKNRKEEIKKYYLQSQELNNIPFQDFYIGYLSGLINLNSTNIYVEDIPNVLKMGNWCFLYYLDDDASFDTTDDPVTIEGSLEKNSYHLLFPLTPKILLEIIPSSPDSYESCKDSLKLITNKEQIDLVNRYYLSSNKGSNIFTKNNSMLPK